MNNKRMTLTSYGPWELKKCVGSGGFGEVHYWRHNLTGQDIATKRLKPNAKFKPDEISILQKRWLQEYHWMKIHNTECIVAAAEVNDNDFLEYLKRQSHIEPSLPVIIMEYCNGGDLRGQLNKIENLNGLVEYEVRSILYTLRESIKYLHIKCKIEHRDIKPENIVIHIIGNRKIYKLADFGYARSIPDYTMLQSVVGTLNYVAPEVIESGCYTQTVDYWSAGQVACEIICGTLPFIPHQNFVKRITAIKDKPQRCIQIFQKIDDLHKDEIEYDYELPYCNHCSPIFNYYTERWLYLSLDKNYKTRGYGELNKLQFYSLLDGILDMKILTVFSLKKLKIYYYDIESFPNMQAFAERLASDNNININNLFLITPPLHPKKHIECPSDYFVEEWCDTSNQQNPPVMLFINEFIKENDYNFEVKHYFSPSATIIKLMNTNPQDCNVPQWLLEQFEREVHFILTEKQNLLTCYMMGLQRFVMQIQHQVFLYETIVCEVKDKILILSGNVQLFSTIIDEIKHLQNEHFKDSIAEDEKVFIASTQQLKYNNNVITAAYKSILGECKEVAELDFYKEIIEKDIFSLKEYRSFLAHVNNNAQRLEKAQHYFENCYQKFSTFLEDSKRKEIINKVDEQLKRFNSLQCTVATLTYHVDDMVKKVEKATRSLLRDYHTNNKLSSQMDILNIDGAKLNSTNISLINPSLALNCDSMTLMRDSLQLMEVINEQCSLINSLP